MCGNFWNCKKKNLWKIKTVDKKVNKSKELRINKKVQVQRLVNWLSRWGQMDADKSHDARECQCVFSVGKESAFWKLLDKLRAMAKQVARMRVAMAGANVRPRNRWRFIRFKRIDDAGGERANKDERQASRAPRTCLIVRKTKTNERRPLTMTEQWHSSLLWHIVVTKTQLTTQFKPKQTSPETIELQNKNKTMFRFDYCCLLLRSEREGKIANVAKMLGLMEDWTHHCTEWDRCNPSQGNHSSLNHCSPHQCSL